MAPPSSVEELEPKIKELQEAQAKFEKEQKDAMTDNVEVTDEELRTEIEEEMKARRNEDRGDDRREGGRGGRGGRGRGRPMGGDDRRGRGGRGGRGGRRQYSDERLSDDGYEEESKRAPAKRGKREDLKNQDLFPTLA